jgi:hypothetical protein
LRRINGFALSKLESEQSFTSDMSLGMSMDVMELVIYGLLAIWGPPLLFVAYLLRPIK